MKTPRFLVAACISLALAFTFSCSSDDDDGGGNTGGGSNTGVGSGCSIDGYRTVEIGDQTWMAENLNCNVSGSKCYDNNPANCVTYGRLYNWATAMGLNSSCNSSACASQVQAKHRGICPSGWHIPSDAEWDALIAAVGLHAGTKLKAASGWNPGNGTDDLGFSALPGGAGRSDGSFCSVNYGHWWSSSEVYSGSAYDRFMYYDFVDVYRSYEGHGKSFLFSVRCVQD